MSVPIATRLEQETAKRVDTLVQAPSTPYSDRSEVLRELIEETLVAE